MSEAQRKAVLARLGAPEAPTMEEFDLPAWVEPLSDELTAAYQLLMFSSFGSSVAGNQADGLAEGGVTEPKGVKPDQGDVDGASLPADVDSP